MSIKKKQNKIEKEILKKREITNNSILEKFKYSKMPAFLQKEVDSVNERLKKGKLRGRWYSDELAQWIVDFVGVLSNIGINSDRLVREKIKEIIGLEFTDNRVIKTFIDGYKKKIMDNIRYSTLVDIIAELDEFDNFTKQIRLDILSELYEKIKDPGTSPGILANISNAIVALISQMRNDKKDSIEFRHEIGLLKSNIIDQRIEVEANEAVKKLEEKGEVEKFIKKIINEI